jgi:endonuclease-3 related protein
MPKQHRQDHKKILTDLYEALYRHFGPQDWWPGDSPFEMAVGAILTQNTNWTNVEKAIHNLKDAKVLNAESLHTMTHSRLASLIKPAGYFNVKSKRLKNFITFLITHYKGSMNRLGKADMTILREELLNVNGIGPETADSILLYALNKPVFVIDAYTKRVLSRHNIVPGEIAYHELQSLFHNNIKPNVPLYNEYHALLVMLGKDYCKPKPKCSECPLHNMGTGRESESIPSI